MKIIDTKTGKRVGNSDKEINRQLAKTDPIIRNVDKDLEMDEYSPMDPPEAFDIPASIGDIDPSMMDESLKLLMEEHEAGLKQLADFETHLNNFRESEYRMTREIHNGFNAFFEFFDENLLPHNRKEERVLFPIVNEHLLRTGEHSIGPEITTAIDLFEDDHVKMIQLGALAFNFLGLAARLRDPESQALVSDLAFNTGKELVELAKLHIFREDHTLFPLAQRLLSPEEFQAMLSKM